MAAATRYLLLIIAISLATVALRTHDQHHAYNVRSPVMATNVHVAAYRGNLHVCVIVSNKFLGPSPGEVNRLDDHPLSQSFMANLQPFFSGSLGEYPSVDVGLPFLWLIVALGAWPAWVAVRRLAGRRETPLPEASMG